MSVPNPPSPTGASKAHAAAGTVVFGEAIAQIIIKILNAKWPGFVDDVTAQSVATLIVGGVTWAATYFTPSGG